jgi:hypothetical protein
MLGGFLLTGPEGHRKCPKRTLKAMQTQLSGSAYQAKAILGAWHSGDAHLLRQELDGVSGLRAADSAEEERLELLSEIAREMSSQENLAEDPVCSSLLEHLAFSGMTRFRPRATRASGFGRAAMGAALQ